MYSLDTNIFLDWWERRYPPDVFPAVRNQMEGLVNAQKLFAPEGVPTELQHVGSVNLRGWARTFSRLFLVHDAQVQTEANNISTRFPGFIDPHARHDEADRYVIAVAKIHNLVVVTHETPASLKRRPPRSHYIPDVCRALSVQCIDLVELMRRENWSF
jgi:Domain of unknown function (DUF4411)